MPTENPKISAYVPQVIYDRFKEFKEERNLSFSQAATEVFAQYFGINLADNSTNEYTGGLPSRISELEQIVADLKQSYIYLSDKVDCIQSTSELSTNSLLIGSSNGKLLNEPLADTKSNLLIEPESELPITRFLIEQQSKLSDDGEVPSDDKSEPLELLPYQAEIIDSQNQEVSSLLSNPLGSLDIKINYSTLASRLGLAEGSVKIKKSKSSSEQFTEWSTKRDQDKIGWQSIKEGKRLYFCPATDLSDEQKANFQNWLTKNQDPVDLE